MKSKKIVYKCKENDTELVFIYKNVDDSIVIDEVHVGISGLGSWTVVGFRELLTAIGMAESKEDMLNKSL